MKHIKRFHYPLFDLLLLAVALGLGFQVLASAYGWAHGNWLSGVMDVPPNESVPFMIAGFGLLLLAGAIIYLWNLDTFAPTRRRFWVFLNALAPVLFLGIWLTGWDVSASISQNMTYVSKILVPLVILVPPVALLAGEKILGAICLRLGQWAEERGWRPLAMRLFAGRLCWAPGDAAVQRALGFLCYEEDEFAAALSRLELLGSLAGADEVRVRALDQCYRALGRYREALQCLLRLRDIQPQTPGLDRRILDDYLRLDMNQEALDLIESGRVKEDFDLLLLRQKLNVKLRNHAQALNLTARIARQEAAPFKRSVRLYEELLDLLPDNIEIKISLGMLLLKEDIPGRRPEGAALIEKAWLMDKRRLNLARELAHYYCANRDTERAVVFMESLVEGGDTDPEIYLRYDQILEADGQIEHALSVVRRMVEVLPEDWRGHAHLARLLLDRGELPAAETACREADLRAPGKDDPLLQHLRKDIERLERERMVTAIAEDLDANDGEADEWDDERVDKRLELIRQLITMERVDQAIDQCERLLEGRPDMAGAVEELIKDGLRHVQQGYRLRDYLGDIFFQQGRYDEVLEVYRLMAGQSLQPETVLIEGCRKILGRAPDHMESRRELALVLRGQNDWTGAMDVLTPPLTGGNPAMAPEDKALWVEAAYRLDRLDDAARVGVPLADQLIGEVGYVMMLIDLLQDSGQYETAYDIYQKARAANPDDRRLQSIENQVIANERHHRLMALQQRHQAGTITAAEHFQKAELHHQLEQLDEAITHFQLAADDPALSPYALAKMAACLCERGMLDLAQETLQPIELTRDIAQQYPEIKELFYIVARNLERTKRYRDAAQIYKRIFRADAAYRDIVERLERFS
ncbi:MAG: tetratricopeptide repeat protein [bacterium]|nr:tetratricopeptide repeat protein [bacterium]